MDPEISEVARIFNTILDDGCGSEETAALLTIATINLKTQNPGAVECL